MVQSGQVNWYAPAVSRADVLWFANWVLFGVGAAIVLGTALYWIIRVRRDPLADVPLRPNGLTPESVLLPMLVWMITGSALSFMVDHNLEGDALAGGMIWAGNAAQLLGAGACLWVAARFFEGGTKRFLLGDGQVRRDAVAGIAYLLAAMALCPLVLAGTERLVVLLDPQYTFSNHEVINALRHRKVPTITLWLGTVVVAPIAEECFFRGVLQTTLENLMRRRWIPVLLTAAVFGAVHAGGDTPQPHVVPALMALGVLLGMLYLRTGSLVGPVVLHALFNGKTLLFETVSHGGA